MKSQTSLGKALRLLFAIGEATNPAGIGVAELMKAAKVSRPTAYRFLNELEQFGLVRSVPKQPMWQLGPKVIALAAQAGSWAIMRRRAKVAMEEFVQSGGPTVHLGIRDGNEVVYIDKAESVKFATISSVVGQRRPLNVTALGKCLVAFDANAELAENLVDAGLVGRTKIRLQVGSVGFLRLLRYARTGLLTMSKNVMSVHAVLPLRFATRRATLSLPLAFRRFRSKAPKVTCSVWSARSGSLPPLSARLRSCELMSVPICRRSTWAA